MIGSLCMGLRQGHEHLLDGAYERLWIPVKSKMLVAIAYERGRRQLGATLRDNNGVTREILHLTVIDKPEALRQKVRHQYQSPR
jgi:hypothetical protein